MSRLRAFRKDEGAATAVEYALLGSLVSIVVLTAMPHVSGPVRVLFETILASVLGGSSPGGSG